MKKHQLNWKTWAVGSIILLLIIVTGNDYYRISQYKSFPIKPKQGLQTFESKVYYDLVKGEQPIEWSQLDNTLAFIENQYDCSDFRFVNLTRILYEFEDQIPSDYKSKIEKVIFNFRYWWDEPGENSMCYWSENHQILFASAEYLMGQKYPDVIFPNSKLSGKQHMEKAQVRILDWLNMRWQYGFTEFYSSVYYKEDVAALINLIDFSTNEEVRIKSQIVMDLLFYDVASQNCKGMFISASGRAYESNRKGGLDATLGGVTQYYWGNGQEIDRSLMYGLMVTKKYHLPAVLREIGLDSSSVVIKQSNGLEVQDLESEGFHTKNDHGMMMQWGMEAFVNPVIIRNSLAHIRQSNMFSNQFISDFKWLDFTVLRTLRLEPFLMKVLDSQFQGTAIQKGNTYTYKTKDYSLYTVQGYHPGEYADQHHISGMNIKNNFAIFHAHPAVSKTKETVSPSYWVGYGHLPHSVQSENVNLSIYNIPTNKGLMEKDLLDFTYAYFPKGKFDTTVVKNNFAFGKKGDTYAALIGANELNYADSLQTELIQKGKQVFWITEAGSKSEDGTFEDFMARVQKNSLNFDSKNLVLHYHSRGGNYELKYKEVFKVNDQPVDSNYSRYQSPYIVANKKAKTFKFELNGHSLFLDFDHMIRTIN